jgi:hypothetical protein
VGNLACGRRPLTPSPTNAQVDGSSTPPLVCLQRLIPSETCGGGTKVGQPKRDKPEEAHQAAPRGESPAKAAVTPPEPPLRSGRVDQ